MPIVQTIVKADDYEQRGGGRYVVERHTDHLGNEYMAGPYLAQPGFDYNARATARAAEIEQQLAEAEVDQELASVAA